MKSSVCCTTQSKFVRVIRSTIILLAGLSASSQRLVAQSGAPSAEIERWNQISSKNSLVGDGKTPFHLKVQFQIFDLGGSGAQQGTLEEWWAGDQGYSVEINSSSEHVVLPGKVDLADDVARRENYLVMQLFHTIVAPMSHLRLDRSYNVFKDKRKDGNVALTCYQAGSVYMNAPSTWGSFACVDETSMNVRQVPYGGETAARNSMATFHDTNVSLDARIAYNNVVAIEGHVSTLQTLNAITASEKLKKPDPSDRKG